MSLSASLIPVMLIMLITAFMLKFFISPTLLTFFSLSFIVFILPPLLWRLSRVLVPVEHGMSSLDDDAENFNGWVISNQLQKIYNYAPVIEILLKCIPGLYSAWLRLWGASIGEKIQWSLAGKVIDRPFIHIGDRCIIGQKARLKAHQLRVSHQKTILILSEVRIESDAIILRPIDL